MNVCICPKNTLIWPKIVSLDWPQTSNSINLKNSSLNLFICDKQHVPFPKTTKSDSTWIKAYDHHYQQDSKKNMNTAGGIHSTQLIQYRLTDSRLDCMMMMIDDGASWACWTKTLTYIPKIRNTQHFNTHYPHLFVVCPVPTTSSSPPPS